jgi:hypothetical protein
LAFPAHPVFSRLPLAVAERQQAVSVWQCHAERIRREQEIAHRRQRLDSWLRWLEEHPWQAYFVWVGIAAAILEVAMLLRYAIEFLAR